MIGVAHPRWDERPLACVVPRKGSSLDKDVLLEHLRPHVARFWLPEDIVFIDFIDEVPKTSVGKFDKKVLRKRFDGHFVPAAADGAVASAS